MFVIEDIIHGEQYGQFAKFDQALAELRQRAAVPWDQPPNLAPCTDWRTCGREYAIVEYDDSVLPWKWIQQTEVFEVTAAGVKWANGFSDSQDS
jgi:hypothetical protein